MIKVDANAAIAFANNTASAGRMKHIDVRLAWMKELRSRKLIEFEKVDGTINLADFFTKVLDSISFCKQHAGIMRSD